jgi:hypothetical protein
MLGVLLWTGLACGGLAPGVLAGGPDHVYEVSLDLAGHEGGIGIVADHGGNAYVAGFTGGSAETFVLALDPEGATRWMTTLSGGGLDEPAGIALAPDGTIVVAGRTLSADFPTVNAPQSSLDGPSDGWIARLAPSDGSILMSTYFGGNNNDALTDVAVRDDGAIVIVGRTASIDLPTTADAVQDGLTLISCFCDDAYVAVLSADAGSVLYGTYLGGGLDDQATAVAIGPNGDLYLAGRTRSQDFPTQQPMQAQPGGGDEDAFLARIALDGGLVYSTYLGGADRDWIMDMIVDGSGQAIVTGWTNSSGMPTTPGAYQPVLGGQINGCDVPFGADRNCYDAFVTRVAADGSLVFGTFLGGSRDDQAFGLALGPGGDIVVTGQAQSVDFPDGTPGIFVSQIAGDGSSLDYTLSTFGNGGLGADVDTALGDVFVTGDVRVPTRTYIARIDPPATAPAADVNGDGSVDVDDLLAVMQAWGPCDGCPEDVDGSGMVDVDDLLAVLLIWS